MNSNSAYDVSSFAANINAEIERLNAQVDLFWPQEGNSLEQLGLHNQMSLLDCGCGPGRLLELIAQRYPDAHYQGVEIDEKLVKVAQQRMAQLQLSIPVTQGSAEATRLEPASFDFIILRLVLEHLAKPLDAITHLASLLREGGKLIVISNDFEYHLRTHPPVPELEQLYAAYCLARQEDSGNPCIGREVPQLLSQAGLQVTNAYVELAHNGIIGDAPFLKSEGSGIPAQLVAKGYLSEAILESLTRNWVTMLKTPGHSIARQLWVAVGAKSKNYNAALSDEMAENSGHDLSVSLDSQSEFDPVQKTLQLIKHMLKKEELSQADSLSALGIDSITAIMLQDEIKALSSIEIPLQHLLSDRPISLLLQEIAKGEKSHTVPENQPNSEQSSQWDEGEL